MMIPYNDFGYFYMMPYIPRNCDKPPTIYSILESIVNAGNPEPVKIKDLAKYGRTTIFDFDYPLTNNISKEDFECMILNHYLQRRINFDTVTSFRIHLNVKLNEIMPMFNKMFDAIEGWNIFKDGEKTTRYGSDNRNIKTDSNSSNELDNTSNTISDRRESNTPQSFLENVREGKYVTNYNYDTDSDTSKSKGISENKTSTSDDNIYNEIIEKDVSNKLEILKQFQTEIKSVYSLLFKELDDLFYGLI